MEQQQLSPKLHQWIPRQLHQASRAIYEDQADIRINARFTSTTSDGGALIHSSNHDEPEIIHIGPESIAVDGVRHVGGIDISYRVDEPSGEAVIAMVILEYPSMKLKHTFLEKLIATEPYIPSFLAMRELEHVLMIYDTAKAGLPPEDVPEVVFVDGFGRWHERQAGLATALGAERGIRTIGIGKEYQPLRPDLGQLASLAEWPIPIPPWPAGDHWRLKQKSFRAKTRDLLLCRGDFITIPLYRGGPAVGAAVYTAPGQPRRNQPPLPAYISPGNLITLDAAIALTMTCTIRPHSRLPEAIILADRLGRDEVKRIWG